MTVTAPPRLPPLPERETADDLEALIEEARRRARRRRLCNAAVALGVGAIILAGLGAQFLGGDGSATKAAAPLPTPPKPTPVRPRPLPENGAIAFVQSDPLSGSALFARWPKGSSTRRLAGCPGRYGDCNFGSFAWSPDGRYVAFLAGHQGGAITRTDFYVYLVAANGGHVRELARCGNCGSLAWSPDSRRLAVGTETGLYAVDIASGALRPLAGGPGATAAWSPDGSRIGFATGAGLYSVRPDGSGLDRIASVSVGGQDISDLDWSPDGTRIVFDGADSIYVVGADGSHLKRILAGAFASGPSVPSWSPNGRRILYFYTPGTPSHFTGQVWSMRPDGSDRRLLYDAGCCVGLWSPPVWSPDGRWIAFSGATEKDGVVVMDANGEHRRQLVAISSAVSWQPLAR